jgi:predicted molibdopterin-dependent oxidoreductase YjgC
MAGRAQRLRPGARPADGAAAGWEILAALGHRLGAPVAHRSSREAFEAAASSRLAFTGLSYASLGVSGQVIGPTPAPPPSGAGAPAEPAGEGLALVAMTEMFGDASAWRAGALAAWRTGAAVALNPAEAGRLGLVGAARVEVASPEGRCVLPLRIDAALPEGGAFVALGAPGSGAEALLPPDRHAVRVTLTAAA